MPKYRVDKKYSLVKNNNNQVVYAIKNGKDICDMDGNQVAAFSLKEIRINGNNKVEVSIYESEDKRFECIGNKLSLNGEFVGTVIAKKRTRSNLVVVMMSILSLIGTIGFILLINTGPGVPVFNVEDNGGDWEEQGTIAVFSDKIHPESSGTYNFIISNESTDTLVYSFSIEEKYEGELEYNYFINYRLRMNDELISPNENLPASTWFKSYDLVFNEMKFLPGTSQLMSLEWEWPFESDKDEEDTMFGIESGKLYIVLNVAAEVYLQ